MPISLSCSCITKTFFGTVELSASWQLLSDLRLIPAFYVTFIFIANTSIMSCFSFCSDADSGILDSDSASDGFSFWCYDVHDNEVDDDIGDADADEAAHLEDYESDLSASLNSIHFQV